MDKRHRYGGATHWGPGVPRHRTSAAYWKQPLKWNELAGMEKHGQLHQDGWQGEPGFWPVFPSLCDPFDNEVPDEWRVDFFDLIRRTPNLTWLLLTKRIGNVNAMMPATGHFPNAWIGASIVNQEEHDRDFRKIIAITRFEKRFYSYEPALGPVSFTLPLIYQDATGGKRCLIDQVIVGGESSQGGAKARPFDIEWARSTVRQCKAAGVAAFVKQVGSAPVDTSWPEWDGKLKDRAGADPAEWPPDIRVQEFPIINREEACRQAP